MCRHSVSRIFDCERLDHRYQCAFGCGVVFTAWLAGNRGETCGCDQPPARTAGFGTLSHVPRGVFERMKDAVEVDCHDAAPLFERHLVECRATPPGSGVGETTVDPTVGFQCFCK